MPLLDFCPRWVCFNKTYLDVARSHYAVVSTTVGLLMLQGTSSQCHNNTDKQTVSCARTEFNISDSVCSKFIQVSCTGYVVLCYNITVCQYNLVGLLHKWPNVW